MEEKKYPCRTETITGISYYIKIYGPSSGKPNIVSTFHSKEEAESYVERMAKRLPEYRFEITESPWTNEVCVECGREEY